MAPARPRSLDVALATCARLPEPDPDARPLAEALAAAGITAEPLAWDDGIRDYVADSCGGLTPSGPVAPAEPFFNPHPCYEFQRGIGDILGAVIQAGLTLREFREYEYTNGWKPFTEMNSLPGRRWAMPDGTPALPLMYGLVAERA